MNKLFIFLLLCILSTTACAQDSTAVADTTPDIITLHLPSDPLQMSPVPLIYKKWWKEVEKCTKLKISDDIAKNTNFFMVPSPFFFVGDQEHAAFAVTFPMYNRIYVSGNYMMDKGIIEHEMIHVLMYHNGLNFWEHPLTYYGKGKCAPLAEDRK